MNIIMLVIINAFKSITRSKGRNILIGIIVLTIAASSSIALAIRTAAEAARESGTAAQAITGTISLDRQKLMEGGRNSSSGGADPGALREIMRQYADLDLDQLQSYARSDLVRDFYYTASVSLDAGEGLEPYSLEERESGSAAGRRENGPPGFGGSHGGEFGWITMGDLTVTGYSSESAMTEFVSGESRITAGTMFDPASCAYHCLITAELAAFNGISVGDKIILANPNQEQETYPFTVTGIYASSGDGAAGDQPRFGPANDPANRICTSYNALNNLAEESSAAAITGKDGQGRETTTALSLQTAGVYVFGNRADFDRFADELKGKGLSEYYILASPDLSSYEQSLIPLENLSSFATTLLLIILAVGAVILIVLNIFNIRERKYEVGVLTAIGIKKARVAAQFVLELLVVTLIAIVLGTGIGAAGSVPVANRLLESQIQAQESAQSRREQSFGRPGGGSRAPGVFGGSGFMEAPRAPGGAIAYLSTINAGVNLDILLELIGIGILLTVLSSLAGVVFVLRYDPLEILANRS